MGTGANVSFLAGTLVARANSKQKSPHEESRMAHYIDGFVVPVPSRSLDAYRRMAEQAGKVTSFPQSVQLKDDEVVVFSWILYDSREHRDSVNAKVMEDPRIKDMMDPKRMPFDGMRMFWGGFKSLIELSPG